MVSRHGLRGVVGFRAHFGGSPAGDELLSAASVHPIEPREALVSGAARARRAGRASTSTVTSLAGKLRYPGEPVSNGILEMPSVEHSVKAKFEEIFLITYKAQVGTTAFLGSRASLPAWTTAGLHPSAGWKPAIPGGRRTRLRIVRSQVIRSWQSWTVRTVSIQKTSEDRTRQRCEGAETQAFTICFRNHSPVSSMRCNEEPGNRVAISTHILRLERRRLETFRTSRVCAPRQFQRLALKTSTSVPDRCSNPEFLPGQLASRRPPRPKRVSTSIDQVL